METRRFCNTFGIRKQSSSTPYKYSADHHEICTIGSGHLLMHAILISFILGSLALRADSSVHRKPIPLDMSASSNNEEERTSTGTSSIRVGHLGNSIQYYDDCPRLLEHMLQTKFDTVHQDSCLRGGATIPSLYDKGNGMAKKFATPNALRPDGSYDIGQPTVKDLILQASDTWDFLIMNDHTQSPVREESRKQSLQYLEEQYLPLIQEQETNDKKSMLVFIMTAAYRKPVKNSEDLGTFDDFTQKLQDGYAIYQTTMPNSKVAPVGLAYQYVRNHYSSNPHGFHWEMLYAIDDFHPSPHGTLLQAYVLYATMLGSAPPQYNATWWKTARVMQPKDAEPLPLPTLEEAELLRQVACTVCKIPLADENDDEDKGRETKRRKLQSSL